MILELFLTVSLKLIITLHTTWEQIVQSRHYGILSMKTYHNVVNSIICKSRLSLIVRVKVVLNRTVVVDSD